MEKYFCFGKKDFCTFLECDEKCPFYDGSGGDYREAPMTNADRIRAMSDEELATLLCLTCWKMTEEKECLNWLQQPAEGE